MGARADSHNGAGALCAPLKCQPQLSSKPESLRQGKKKGFSDEKRNVFPKTQKCFDRRDLGGGGVATDCRCTFKSCDLFPPRDEMGSSEVQEVFGCGVPPCIPQQLSS